MRSQGGPVSDQDLAAAVMSSFPDLAEHDDEDAVRMLCGGPAAPPVSVRQTAAQAAEAALAADNNRRSPIWTLAEDLKLCGRVIDCGGLDKKLSPAWFRAAFAPRPVELQERNSGALILRFNYLRDELLLNLAKAHREGRQEMPWDWLEEKHRHTLSKDYYTFEQDLAICQLVVERGMIGRKVGQKWFRENVVGRVPLLAGRNASGLYGRYSKRLCKKLSRAVLFSPGGTTSYKWLRELHGIVDPSAADDTNEMLLMIDGREQAAPLALQLPPRMTDPVDTTQRQRRAKRPNKYEDDFETEALAGAAAAPVKRHRDEPMRPGKQEAPVAPLSPAPPVPAMRSVTAPFSGPAQAPAVAPSSAPTAAGSGTLADLGDKMLVALNVDALGDAVLGLDLHRPLERQLSPQALSQFDLSASECEVLAGGLVLALRGAPRALDTVVRVQLDQDVLQRCASFPPGRLTLTASLDAEGRTRVVSAAELNNAQLLTATPHSRREYETASQPEAQRGGRRSAAFSLEEDRAVCERVLQAAQSAPRLSLAFFEEHVVGRHGQLLSRPTTSLMMRYNNHLQDGLERALAAAKGGPLDFSWLRVRREAAGRPYAFAEHLAMCQAVVAERRVGEQLPETWFRERFAAWEKAGRTAAGLAQEYFVRLMVHLRGAVASAERSGQPLTYDWLRAKHGLGPEQSALQAPPPPSVQQQQSSQGPYTLLEDLALCLRVLQLGVAGEALPAAWFVEQLCHQVPELASRSHLSMEHRYRLQLRARLHRAALRASHRGEPVAFEWLARLHRQRLPSARALASVTGAQVLSTPMPKRRGPRVELEEEDEEEMEEDEMDMDLFMDDDEDEENEAEAASEGENAAEDEH